MKRILTTYFICTSFYLTAQVADLKREIKYTAEVGTYISTDGNTPFWLRANQYGTVPLTSPIVTLRGSISSDYKKAITREDQYKLSKFDWGYGLNIVGNVGKENQFLIPEAYIKAKFGAFEIYAGRRREIFGLVDSTLSSGSYIWSGNALPMPKIQIMNRDFVPLGITKGFLSFKGSFAHGWFENDRTDVKNFYLHQKSLYFRLGKPDWKFKFYGGFNHQVQWGGELLYPDPLNKSGINGKVGSGFNDYINVVTGKSLAGAGDTTKNGANDALNRSGNHLGTVDIGFEINTDKVKVLVYRQNIYEDGSLAYLSNIEDGLNGISFNLKKFKDKRFHVNKLVFEYINTMSQGGIVSSDATDSRLRGQDNYFNNGVYRDGWSYNRNGIGSSFLSTRSEVSNNLLSNSLFTNNRTKAYYLAIHSLITNKIQTNIKLSYGINYGTYNAPFKSSAEQFSLLFNCMIPANYLGGCELLSTVAFDTGKLYNDNLGVYVGLKKRFN